jgi:hypothetical protein
LILQYNYYFEEMVMTGKHRKENKAEPELQKLTPPERDGNKSRLRVAGYVKKLKEDKDKKD